jgi:anthranilate synthase/aminodeoxychorismate synthase-like glutamine amidotransferase
MVLLIDNYDSFTFNIFQAISVLTREVEVVRNDEKTVEELERMKPSHLVISPGPGRPERAGVSKRAVRIFAGRIPVLGVCLGHQAIGEEFGGRVVRAARLMHGKSSLVTHDGTGIFADIPRPFEVIRYHSLAIERASLPPELTVTAEAEDSEVMGLRHRVFTVDGVQFHPESFGTVGGETIFRNFLAQQGGTRHVA